MSLAQVLLGAAANTKVPQRFAPFYNQAISEALVRYGPQWDLLNQARAESAGSLRQRVQQARIAGAMIEDAANRGASTLANAPAPSVNYAGPAGSSAQITGQALGTAREGTLGMLTGAAKDAPVFASQQVAQAQTQHEQDLAKIAGQRSSVAGQVGDYFTGRVNDLITGDRKMRHDANQARAKLDQQLAIANQRNATTVAGQQLAHQDRQAAISQRRQAAANKPGAKAKSAADQFQAKFGVKPASTSEYQTANSEIARAIGIARTHKQQNDPRPLVANILVNGVSPIPQGTGKPPVPGVKAVKQQIFAQAALDIVYNGQISNGTANALHHMGYSVGQLGLPGSPRQRTPRNTAAVAPAPGGGLRPT